MIFSDGLNILICPSSGLLSLNQAEIQKEKIALSGAWVKDGHCWSKTVSILSRMLRLFF